MDERRRHRLSNDIRLVLGEVLTRRISDNRLRNVTITRVKLSRDGSHASIFFETTGTEEEQSEACTAIESASGFLRSQLASGVRMRTVPFLSFVHDSSGVKGDRVLKIMRRLDSD